jgi:peptide/nickel transport system substrate-binding protein
VRLRIAAALAVVVTTVTVLAACTPEQNTLVAGSRVAVAVTDAFTSANPDTSYGRSSTTNADIALLTTTGFGYLDAQGSTKLDTSFGTAQLISRDPFTVTYTVNQGVVWSDGTPIDAADLLLAWAANSGALNTPAFDDSLYVDATTGRYVGDFPTSVVYFDGRVGGGLEKAAATPVVSDGGRSITVAFASAVPDWRTVLEPGIPAHLLARRALHTTSAAAGKAAVIDAIEKKDAPRLHALAETWNNAYNVTSTPSDARLLVSSGPYSISTISATSVVLTANPRYAGSRRPSFETVTLRVSADPLETARLLASGEVDIATPQPSEKTAAALAAIPGVTVTSGTEARYEHLDLQFAHGKHATFEDERVRRAFLDTVPRQQIVSRVNSPGDAGGGEHGAKVLDSFVLRFGTNAYDAAVRTNGSADYASPDVAAATALLAEAGATDPEVCILYDPSNARRALEFQAIQAGAARAGFVVTDCSNPDWHGLLGVDGAYDAALFAWDTTRLGATGQAAVFRSDAPLANFTHFSDPDADSLIRQLASADAPAEQNELLTKLDTRLWSSAYGMPLYAYPTLTAVGSQVTGVTASRLTGSVFWNAWDWAPAAESAPPQ